MPIKFYGTVSGSNGNIMSGIALSNNFSVTRNSAGSYTITLEEWVHDQPVIQAFPLSTGVATRGGGTTACAAVSGQSTVSDDDIAWTFNVSTNDGDGQNDVDFSFTALCGSNLVVPIESGSTIELAPDMATLDDNTILRTAFTISGTKYYVDSATSITIVGLDSVSASMNTSYTYTDADGNTTDYTLAAYSYQPGDTSSTQWDGSDGVVTASLSTPGTGIPTTEHRLYITATDSEGNVLWSDPVIRLSKESPDGITADTVGDGT